MSRQSTDQRVPPHDLGLEAALLGAALMRQSILDDLQHTVDPMDFYKVEHQTIWQTMLHLHDIGANVDPITVAEHSGVPLEVLLGVQNNLPAISAYGTYANRVIELARHRHILAQLADIADACYMPNTPADDILTDVEHLGSDRLVSAREAHISNLYTASEFKALSPERAIRYPWLIPGIIRRRWRIMLVGPEGIGKGTLFRQLGLHAAAGRDPFNPDLHIDPIRVLYVDTENPETTVELQMDLANTQTHVDLYEEAEDRFYLWHQDAGINIRQPRDRAHLEAVIRKAKPDLVIAGPFYKMWRRKQSEDLEQTTIEVLEILDQLRTRYDFGLILEHHLPKGQGLYREKDPFGSAALKRWPEMGITLTPLDGVAGDYSIESYELSRFRADREPANWPTSITKNKPMQVVAWTGYWEHGR